MRNFRPLPLILPALLAVLSVACTREPEERYRDATMSEWIQRTRDLSPDVRVLAIGALSRMQSPAAREAVVQAIEREANTGVCREVVAFDVLPEESRLSALRKVVASDTDGYHANDTGIQTGIMLLGPKAAEFVPWLQRGKSQPGLSSTDREYIDRAIEKASPKGP